MLNPKISVTSLPALPANWASFKHVHRFTFQSDPDRTTLVMVSLSRRLPFPLLLIRALRQSAYCVRGKYRVSLDYPSRGPYWPHVSSFRSASVRLPMPSTSATSPKASHTHTSLGRVPLCLQYTPVNKVFLPACQSLRASFSTLLLIHTFRQSVYSNQQDDGSVLTW